MKLLSNEELERRFDDGEDLSEYVDWSSARVLPALNKKAAAKVNIDFNKSMLSRIDAEAERIGVPRQSLLKVWISERLDQEAQKHETA